MAGVGLGASARGLMYALAFLGRRSVLDILRGRRGTWGTARGLMYALAFLGRRSAAVAFCVAGVGLGASARGLMYALAFLGRRSVLDILRGRRGTWGICARSDVRFGVSGPPLCRCRFLRGRRGTCCVCTGLMYALAFLGRRSVLDILRGRRGTWSICARSDVRFGVSGPPLCP